MPKEVGAGKFERRAAPAPVGTGVHRREAPGPNQPEEERLATNETTGLSVCSEFEAGLAFYTAALILVAKKVTSA
jgi:hypothetical protein